MGAFATFLSVILIVFSALLICCSGFYWYTLGAFTGCSGCITNTQWTSIDIVHGGVYVIAGVMGILCGFQLGYPAATIITLVLLFIVAIGLSVEIALVFTLYACPTIVTSNTTSYSAADAILCGATFGNPALGPWFGYINFIIPLAVSWIATISCLLLLIAWQKDDGNFSFD